MDILIFPKTLDILLADILAILLILSEVEVACLIKVTLLKQDMLNMFLEQIIL
jgi:hypothetical protein